MLTASRQQARSDKTRRALLEATIWSLGYHGYRGTTGPAIAERAGLSRGAQLHHFGTRDQLVVAAVEYLAELRLAIVRTRLQDLASSSTERRALAQAALELLSEAVSGPLYAASIELRVAARTDQRLRAVLEPTELRVSGELRRICRTFISSDPVTVQLTLDLLLGQGLSGLLNDGHARAHQRSLAAWLEMIERDAAHGAS